MEVARRVSAPPPVVVDPPEQHLSSRFVGVTLVLSVLISATLIFVLPAAASRVSELTTPAGAITDGRASLQPQPGWEQLTAAPGEPEPQRPMLQKEGVVLGLIATPADEGTDPQTYLERLLADVDDSFVPDSDPVAFTSPTGDQGLAVTATGSTMTGMFGVVVSRDGSQVAMVPAVGDPVGVSALLREISDMITSVRFRRAS